MKSYLFFSLLFLATTNLFAQKKLWYQQPAEVWEEALPIGNGRLGGMVFGNTDTERIQLNEDSLWPGGYSDWGLSEGTPEDLEHVREYLRNGENKKADEFFVSKFSRKSMHRSHQTLGDFSTGIQFVKI